MFKDAKIGDRVFNYLKQQWGTIEKITSFHEYPLQVKFDDDSVKTFTIDGRLSYSIVQTLFWDEVHPIIPPKKPLPDLKVDTKVLVWDEGMNCKEKRYFSNFNKYGLIECFANGKTSWNANKYVNAWNHWELVNDS